MGNLNYPKIQTAIKKELYWTRTNGMDHQPPAHKYMATTGVIKFIQSGGICRYSLAISMIEVTDCVFSDKDLDDEDRSPPLLSASVHAQDGTDTVYCVRVRGNKQSFLDTASVLVDEETNKTWIADRKLRHNKRKRDAEGFRV
jgi:hypothetical protein